jgi:hypothetical protein
MAAPHVLKNVRLFNGGLDLTGTSNQVEIKKKVDAKVCTTFGSYDETSGQVWEEYIGGLASAEMSGGGPDAYGLGLTDEVLSDGLGGVGAWTACPASAAVGAIAHLTHALEGDVATLGAPGDVAPWAGSWKSSSPMPRGVVLHNPATARTSSGDGAAVEHVAVAAGQMLYASLHVLSIAGTDTPTLTVIVESDVDDQFDGSETTRISFDAATAVGGQWKSVAGAITDTFYRVSWTISGTDPSFLWVAAVGVF